MIVRKKYRINLSTKLPNNSIVSVDFETELEDEHVNEEELFERAYKSTMKDVKKKIKEDKLVRAAWESVQEGISQEETLKKSEDWEDYE